MVIAPPTRWYGDFLGYPGTGRYLRVAWWRDEQHPQVQGGLAGLGLLHSRKPQSWVILRITVPIGSMYAIYGNIYHQYTPNVSIYIPYMDPMGYIMINHNIQSIFWPWRKSQSSSSSSSSSSFSENVHHYGLLREVNTCPFAVQVAAKAICKAGQGVARSGCLKAQWQPEAKFSWGVGIGVTLARYLRTGTPWACQGFWVNSTSGPQKGYAAEPPSFWSFLLKEDDLIWLSEFSGTPLCCRRPKAGQF